MTTYDRQQPGTTSIPNHLPQTAQYLQGSVQVCGTEHCQKGALTAI